MNKFIKALHVQNDAGIQMLTASVFRCHILKVVSPKL